MAKIVNFRMSKANKHIGAMWNLYGEILGWRCKKCNREFRLEWKCSKTKYRKVLHDAYACCHNVKMEEGE